ncbi:hypothetical protein V1477_008960 [Vespula maculifrons]|uniref:Uncharacterized protein n=1 Tax=Vespula maculifrons TaxID=7453 RepID=A0ABD2CEH5_VESMC
MWTTNLELTKPTPCDERSKRTEATDVLITYTYTYETKQQYCSDAYKLYKALRKISQLFRNISCRLLNKQIWLIAFL